MTTYEYDEDDRLIYSSTVTESEWSAADYAQMQALEIYEASLCPGCQRPLKVCAADFGNPVSVDKHICNYTQARAVQQRYDDWENADRDKRGAAPLEPLHSDGAMYAPRPSSAQELAD